MSVNRERVQLLVDALRSGEFTQGNSALEYVEDGVAKNCCLGVACRIAQRNGLELTTWESDIDFVNLDDETNAYKVVFASGGENPNANFLPWSVSQWFGFDSQDPSLKYLDEDDGEETERFDPASDLNDGMSFDFNQIADAFERTYLSEE